MNPLKYISSLFKKSSSELDNLTVSEEVKKRNHDIKLNDLGIFNYNALGFDIDLKEEFHSIKWTDIERLEVYKADLVTTDEICMDITYNNKTIIITEETKGWYQFTSKVKSALPITNTNWESSVLETPFEYNLTTIYERADRQMPVKNNFYSTIKNTTKEDVTYCFQENGWRVRKSTIKDFELNNSWSELVLENNQEELILHGRIAYHPDNVKIITQLFDDLKSAYKFEIYDIDKVVEQAQIGM